VTATALQLHRRRAYCPAQQRQELIGAPDFSRRQQRIATEAEALAGAQDVTASLRRTKQLMMQNLEQTHGNISVLCEWRCNVWLMLHAAPGRAGAMCVSLCGAAFGFPGSQDISVATHP
jgi:hypothetical protein